MHVFVETPRLVLRRFTMADVDNLVSLDADPDVMHFITGGIPTARGEIETEILPAFLGYYERYEGYGFWAAIEKPAGQFLGWFHFRPREGASPDEAELGYRLRKSAWGKGYATEGSRALIRKGFTEFGVQRVAAEAMAVNLTSRRVMEKAGLTLVRTFHQRYRERQRLADIQAAIDAIRSHLRRGDLSDGLLFDAVRIRLVEIGNAVKALPEDLLAAQPSIPWRQIARMRDHLCPPVLRYRSRNPAGHRRGGPARLERAIHALNLLLPEDKEQNPT